MSRIARTWWVLGWVVVACGAPAPAPRAIAPAPVPEVAPAPPAAPGAASETLAADAARTTADGHRFTAPAGWTLRRSGPAVILDAPEAGSRIALVDVDGADAAAAIAAAWAAYDPAARWPLTVATARPVRDGWDQIHGVRYAVPADQQRGVSAVARRRGTRWSVAILDLADAVSDKRDSQIALIGKLLPAGYQRETFAGRPAQPLDAQRLAALAQFIEAARIELAVPGAAVGIVQDGRVVLAAGYGVRELGKPARVDADTRFMIASNTKALTTLMLAKLVEAGRFTWDTPVTQVLPSFRLGDAATTRQVMMKHLVCACTGLPRQDLEWIFEGERLTPAAVVAALATMQPTSAFGELYQYSNLMAGAAGYAGGHALYPQRELGAAYDAAMQRLVFDPLGMASTTFDFARALRGNHASPHGQDVDGRTVVVGMQIQYTNVPSRPDGGAWSNVRDMLRYVQMELDRGALPGGRRYIAEAPLLARRTQQVATGVDSGYGMGLKLDRSFGVPLIQHGGSTFGYVSNMLWLPEHGVGLVILTNADTGGSALRNLVRRRWMELLFDGQPEAVPNLPIEAERLRAAAAAERARLTVPAADTDALARRYRSPELGDLVVTRRGRATWFDVGGWRSEVASRRDPDGTLTFVTVSPGANGFELVAGAPGGPRALHLRDAQHAYTFVEVPGPSR